MISLYIINAEKLLGMGVSELWEVFPFGESERARIEKIRSSARRAESLAGLVALHRLLMGRGIEPTDIARSERGKPFFTGESAPQFSISHTGLISVAALSDSAQAPIGIDAEISDPDRVSEKVVDRFFDERERRVFSSADDRTRAFFEIWTKKEALAKLDGSGVFDSAKRQDGVFYTTVYPNVGGKQVVVSVCCRDQKQNIQIFGDHGE